MLKMETESQLDIETETGEKTTLINIDDNRNNHKEDKLHVERQQNIKKENEIDDSYEKENEYVPLSNDDETIVNFEASYVKEERYDSKEEALHSNDIKIEDVRHTSAEHGYEEIVNNINSIDNIKNSVDNKYSTLRRLLEDGNSSSSQIEEKNIEEQDETKSTVWSDFYYEHEKNYEENLQKTRMILKRRFECMKCHKKYYKLNHIKNHINSVHLGIRDYKCEECYKTFSTTTLVKRHTESVHGKIKNHECQMCKKRFLYTHHLNQHVKVIHRGIKDYECYECHKRFFEHCKVKNHINRMHLGIRDYKCDQCQKTFSQLPNLKKHIDAVHRKDIKYDCQLCNKRFTCPSHLKLHINTIHKGIKNYLCEECGKKFQRLLGLKIHTNMVHLRIRDYKCQYCSRIFTKSTHLKRHLLRKINNYECEVCNANILYSCLYKQHIETAHKRGKSYECNKCEDRTYIKYSTLKRHIYKTHK